MRSKTVNKSFKFPTKQAIEHKDSELPGLC